MTGQHRRRKYSASSTSNGASRLGARSASGSPPAGSGREEGVTENCRHRCCTSMSPSPAASTQASRRRARVRRAAGCRPIRRQSARCGAGLRLLKQRHQLAADHARQRTPISSSTARISAAASARPRLSTMSIRPGRSVDQILGQIHLARRYLMPSKTHGSRRRSYMARRSVHRFILLAAVRSATHETAVIGSVRSSRSARKARRSAPL